MLEVTFIIDLDHIKWYGIQLDIHEYSPLFMVIVNTFICRCKSNYDTMAVTTVISSNNIVNTLKLHCLFGDWQHN
jgi:hypothetical protein